MIRLFQPVGGRADRSHIKIDEHGNSFIVKADGTEVNEGFVDDLTKHWKPTWTILELENLVRAGNWEEMKEASPSENSPAPVVAQSEVTIQGDSSNGIDTH